MSRNRNRGAVVRPRQCQRDVGPKGNRELCTGQAYAKLVNVLGQPDVCKNCYNELGTDVDPCVRAWLDGAVVYGDVTGRELPPLPPAA